jgi:hypothetical protein
MKRFSNTAPLVSKDSGTLELSKQHGGRRAVEEENLRLFLQMNPHEENTLRVLKFGRYLRLYDRDLNNISRCKTVRDVFPYFKELEPYEGTNPQTLVFLAAVYSSCYSEHRCCELNEEWNQAKLRTDYHFVFKFHRDYVGSIIVELADKTRTVSTQNANMVTIGSYLASSFRSVLLRDAVYSEGYRIEEEMEELLKRLNTKGPTTNVITSAIRAFIEQGNEEVFLRVTDFSAATEYLSWEAVRILAIAVMNSSAELADIGDEEPILGMIADFMMFSSQPFTIKYRHTDSNRDELVEGLACGCLMGAPMTKEILHFFANVCSCIGDRRIDEMRLILGDDLLMLGDKAFYKMIRYPALQSNVSKEDSGFFVNITDRCICLRYDLQEEQFKIIGSRLRPPKNFSPVRKYTQGFSMIPEKPKITSILDCLTDGTGKVISFPKTYKILYDFITTNQFMKATFDWSSEKYIPFIYGGLAELKENLFREYCLSQMVGALAILAVTSTTPIKVFCFPAKLKTSEESFSPHTVVEGYFHKCMNSCPYFLKSNTKEARKLIKEIRDELEKNLDFEYPKIKLDPEQIFFAGLEQDLKLDECLASPSKNLEFRKHDTLEESLLPLSLYSELILTGNMTSGIARRIGGNDNKEPLFEDPFLPPVELYEFLIKNEQYENIIVPMSF